MELSVDRAHLATPETPWQRSARVDALPSLDLDRITGRGEIAYLSGPGLAPADPFGEDLRREYVCRFDTHWSPLIEREGISLYATGGTTSHRAQASVMLPCCLRLSSTVCHTFAVFVEGGEG
jgi:hypothetical protein